MRRTNRRSFLSTALVGGLVPTFQCLAVPLAGQTSDFSNAVPDQWFDPSSFPWPEDLQQVLMQAPGSTPKAPKYQSVPCERLAIKRLSRGSIVRLPSGDLLGSGIGKGKDGTEYISLFRSSDEGHRWTTPTPITNFPSNSRNGYMTVLKDGSILMIFKTTRPQVEPLFSWSKDDGRTWSKPTEGPENVATAHIGGATFSGIVLPSGELVLAMFTWRTQLDASVMVWRSQDGGRTFYEKNLIVQGGFNETTLLLLPSGKIIAALRETNLAYPTDGDDFTAICESVDSGRTWSAPRRVTQAWEHPGHLLRLNDGRLLLLFGVRHSPQGMGALVSEDEGKTWRVDHPFVVSWTGHNEYSGYPWGIVLKDGRVLTQCYLDSNSSETARIEIAIWNVPPLPRPKW